MIQPVENGARLELHSPVKLPNASAFLWNKKMMVHMNCRGYAVAQFMQPEPTKYAHAPNLEAKTFMQPEQPYYAHHPGRFFYIKDEETNSLFSTPYAPVKTPLDNFVFSAGKSDILWKIEHDGLSIEMRLSLPTNEALEQWSFTVKNITSKSRKISIYPYFPVGYMSWMNQSGEYDANLNAIVCSSITPYQKYKEYDRIKTLKDKTYLLADTIPTSWEVNQAAFEGEGGLHNPTGIVGEELLKGDARYETPACVFQYRLKLQPEQERTYRFLFGPAKDEKEIEDIGKRYFSDTSENKVTGFDATKREYDDYIAKGKGCLQIKTPDAALDNFVNNWLPRQIYYHGETNRLSTDPQTRNFLQDNMGTGYIQKEVARQAYITALSQQAESGAMPDGILIHEDAELKYINQVPHTDHCVWLPICLKAYLDETNDYALLQEKVPFSDNEKTATVTEHMNRAMLWLYKNRDERGLNYIEQGDWCDPMNMVGPKGKGVSGWLSMATGYALKTWAGICRNNTTIGLADDFSRKADELNRAINTHLWDGDWYARGITDDNVVFGVRKDLEGRIFLNTQGWALLSGCADADKSDKIIASVQKELETPYGVEMLAPSYTKMREDVGRVTQKFPGSAENGAVYNHAAAFYIFGLYTTDHSEKAYEVLRKMIPGPDEADLVQRGQLPVFIPNYYRGAFRQFPRTAGRSSQLFNTGAAPWLYRCLIDGLFGLKGDVDGLHIAPKLPKAWNRAEVVRQFRGATFKVDIQRESGISKTKISVNGQILKTSVITNIEPRVYEVDVRISEM
ncbi:NdvB protein [Maribacter polysiphoniae]|uniref:Cellobionic acid phosphorylase n=1 Tax=Maribacter polysiphoniae TaxID=429344 RepID=A0A316DPZ6_9FLAO|nr:NdvB protein [Maribacter polysiphoniae]MBD1262836.1 NdvB protein [Maribacter polysiphoniae]PWK20151.1 cellobionic acid phosphorylase [Maribacter polysiphoniae]